MSEHAKKEYTIEHPIFPSGRFEQVEKKLIFLDWIVPFVFLIGIFILLKVFIYHPDEKRKDQ